MCIIEYIFFINYISYFKENFFIFFIKVTRQLKIYMYVANFEREKREEKKGTFTFKFSNCLKD